MKKIIFFILCVILFSPLVASAAEYYCKCDKPVLSGKKCQGGFSTIESMQTVCPTCVQKEGRAADDVDCLGELVDTTASAEAPSTVGASADSGSVVKLNNPLVGDEKDVNAIIGNAIKTATGIMGALVLLMIVYGGITWLTAAGSPEKIKSGSNTIMWAILGAIVVLSSYLLLTAVLKGLSG